MKQQNNLAAFRKSLNFNQSTLADQLRITRACYSSLEHGDSRASKTLLARFKQLYPSVNTDWWAYGKGENQAETTAPGYVPCTLEQLQATLKAFLTELIPQPSPPAASGS